MHDVIIVLFELIVALGFFCYSIKLLINYKKTCNSKPQNIEKNVHDGIKSALKELEEEKIQGEELMKKLDIPHTSDSVFSSIPEEEPIKTGGYLIPTNLSDSEKEILRMFYNQ